MKKIILGLSPVFAAGPAFAFQNVCDLERVPVSAAAGVSAEEIAAYQQRLADECEVYKKYVGVRNQARSLGVNLEEISVYQAMRYMQRAYFDNGKLKIRRSKKFIRQ